jgi:hypothetical protein
MNRASRRRVGARDDARSSVVAILAIAFPSLASADDVRLEARIGLENVLVPDEYMIGLGPELDFTLRTPSGYGLALALAYTRSLDVIEAERSEGTIGLDFVRDFGDQSLGLRASVGAGLAWVDVGELGFWDTAFGEAPYPGGMRLYGRVGVAAIMRFGDVVAIDATLRGVLRYRMGEDPPSVYAQGRITAGMQIGMGFAAYF